MGLDTPGRRAPRFVSTLPGTEQRVRLRPRFCWRFIPLKRGKLQALHCCNTPRMRDLRLAFGYPSPLSPQAGSGTRLGMDFSRYLCHSIRQDQFAAGPSPALNHLLKLTTGFLRRIFG